MLNFRSLGGAEFKYAVDFSDVDFANISFFDRTKKQIIFHLSLRKAKNLAVVNAKRNGEWQGEISKPLEMGGRLDDVAIRFDGETVAVQIEGNELFRFEEEFAGLESVQHINFSGGLEKSSFVIEGAANQNREGEGRIDLGQGLDIYGWGVDTALSQQAVIVEVEGLKEPISFNTNEVPEIAKTYDIEAGAKVGFFAQLPGRIWEVSQAKDAVKIKVTSNGAVCGTPLLLEKSRIAGRIDEIAARGNLASETFNLLLALEHVKFGDLWSKLAKKTQDVLVQTANDHGLEDYLELPDSEQPKFVPAVKTPDTLLLQKARKMFGSRLMSGKSPDAISAFNEVAGKLPLTTQMYRAFLLAVTDEFCCSDQFEDLYRQAATRGAQTFETSKNAWHNSVILPYLGMEGRLGEITSALWSLSDAAGSGWIATPAVGWTIRKVVSDSDGPATDKARDDIIYAFKGLLEKRNNHYWSRLRCNELIRTVAFLITSRAKFSDYLCRDIEKFAVRNYGLSRTFWVALDEALEAQEIEAGAVLRFARSQFEIVRAGVDGEVDGLEEAIAFFESMDNPEAGRFRLELLGPSGLPKKVAENPVENAMLDGLLLRGRNPESALLRGMAFPGAQSKASSQEAAIVRRAIRDRHKDTPHAFLYDQQVSYGQGALAFLTAIAKGDLVADSEEAEDRLQELLTQLNILSSGRSNFLGLGLMIALFDGLIRLEEEALATVALAQLNLLCAQTPSDQKNNLFAQPAIYSALRSLSQTATRMKSELALVGLSLFPRFSVAEDDERTLDPELDFGAITPLFDTIVVVFSCVPYLSKRIDPMREGWLGKLKALGIPYIVVVGDGDGRREGDIVHLDAPDNYEGLPQKTLKSVEWVYENTDFAFMLKIDDDCFINVDEYFQSLSYRKFDYYGRRLLRHKGQTDRVWHFAKSESERGRKELDKSPEPSEYADGGSGYSLSRRAMGEILKTMQTTEGQGLISVSFMEDKMIGDLLSLSKIKVSEEDYYVTIQRRTYGDATPVSLWQNAFFAGPLSPAKQVHMDTHVVQLEAMDRLTVSQLYPRKIWPTFAPVKLGYESNLLELVSSEEKLETLNKEDVAVVACVRNEKFMLPEFLAHYRKLGVKAFLISDNTSDDGTLEYLLEQPDVAVFSVDSSYNNSQYGVTWQMAILANLRVGRWSLVADADELLVYKGWEKTSLPKLLASKQFNDVDAVRLYMLDMYPKGELSKVTLESGDPFSEADQVDKEPFLRNMAARGPFSDSKTVTSALRHRLLPDSKPELFTAQKYALLKYKPWMRPSAGLHYVADLKVAEMEMIFAHFKYNAQFRAKAEAEVARGQHFNDAEEYRKYLALVSEGREVVYDPKVSVHWRDCAEVKRILD